MRAHSLSIESKLLESLSRIHVDEKIRFERTMRGRNIFLLWGEKDPFSKYEDAIQFFKVLKKAQRKVGKRLH